MLFSLLNYQNCNLKHTKYKYNNRKIVTKLFFLTLIFSFSNKIFELNFNVLLPPTAFCVKYRKNLLTRTDSNQINRLRVLHFFKILMHFCSNGSMVLLMQAQYLL